MMTRTLITVALFSALAGACGASQSSGSTAASGDDATECDPGIREQLSAGEGVCLRPDVLGFGVVDACAEVAADMGRSRDSTAEISLGDATDQEVVCFAPAP